MKIAIIGTGFVGLVSGACFASKGHDVLCVDLDPARVETIRSGQPPFFEQGLPELLKETIGRTLDVTLDLESAVSDADVTMLAVGTPYDGTGLDLRQIRQAATQVGEALRGRDGFQLVMVKSTVLPGTTDKVVKPILEQTSGRVAGQDFGVAMNPEFLREGQAVGDFQLPDRIVMGGSDERSWQIQEELYRDFPCSDILRTDNSTAEMIKYTSNSLLATLVSFSNEIGNLCATLPGVDVKDVMRGLHLDKRLSPLVGDKEPVEGRHVPGIVSYLMAGCGFGGSCLPKDVSSLAAFGDTQGSPAQLLRSVLAINAEQPRKIVALAKRHVPSLKGARVAVLGLAFKPGTSDIRETPALPVLHELREHGAELQLYDPEASDEIEAVFSGPDVTFASSLEQAVEGASILIVLTSWPEFRRLPSLLEGAADPPLVIDGRRMFDKDDFKHYDGVGLGPRDQEVV